MKRVRVLSGEASSLLRCNDRAELPPHLFKELNFLPFQSLQVRASSEEEEQEKQICCCCCCCCCEAAIDETLPPDTIRLTPLLWEALGSPSHLWIKPFPPFAASSSNVERVTVVVTTTTTRRANLGSFFQEDQALRATLGHAIQRKVTRASGGLVAKGLVFVVSLLGQVFLCRVADLKASPPEEEEGAKGWRKASAATTKWKVVVENSLQAEGGGREGRRPEERVVVAGLAAEEAELRRLIGLSLTPWRIASQQTPTIPTSPSKKFQPSRGILVSGPSGTGKSRLVHKVASTFHPPFNAIVELSAMEILSSPSSVSRESLRSNKPALLILRDVNTLTSSNNNDKSSATSSSSSLSSAKREAITRLLEFMEDEETMEGACIIGILTTDEASDSSSLPPSLRQAGRFEYELRLSAPDAVQRQDILELLLKDVPVSFKPGEEVEEHHQRKEASLELSKITTGYVGRDLKKLCRQATLRAIIRADRQKLKSTRHQNNSSTELTKRDGLEMVTWNDFREALHAVQPSQMFEFHTKLPQVSWDDIGGCKEVRQKFEEYIEWSRSERFKRLGAQSSGGVLLYGPPGNGKTLCVHAMAAQYRLNFISVKGPEMFSKYFGETEALIRRLFARARQAAPCILFFDEIDAIGAMRDDDGIGGLHQRVLSQMLNEMDGVQAKKDVFVVGCTNRPASLDSALLRPGRFDCLLYVGPPEEEARAELLRIQASKIPFHLGDEGETILEQWAKLTEGLSAAELISVCRDAALVALKESEEAKTVTDGHFREALASFTQRGGVRSVTKANLAYYERFRAAQQQS